MQKTRVWSRRQIARRLLGEKGATVLHAFAWANRMGKPKPDLVMELGLLDVFLGTGDICMDIGAHGGVWSYPMSRKVSRGAVHSFEVFPYYANTLRCALWMRRAKNVRLHAIGLSDVDGEMNLTTADEQGTELKGMIHLTGPDEEPKSQITIPTRRLDSLMDEEPELSKVKFIKIDVEGAELAVFRGAVRMLEEVRPAIYCEVVESYCRRYGHGLNDVVDLMRDARYKACFWNNGKVENVIDLSKPPHDFVFLPNEVKI